MQKEPEREISIRANNDVLLSMLSNLRIFVKIIYFNLALCKITFIKPGIVKKIIPFLVFLTIGTFAFAQKDTNPNRGKSQVTKITPNASGVKRSIGYKFNSITEDKDPGSGIFRYNNKNAASVTYIFVDKYDIKGEDQTNWYETWDDTTGATGRGQLVLVELNGENVNVFDVTGVFIDGNGYWKFPVEYVSGKLPANDSVYFYIFNRIAHTDRSDNENQSNEDNQAPPVTPITPDTLVTVAAPVAPDTLVTVAAPVAPVNTDTLVTVAAPVAPVAPDTLVTVAAPVAPVTPD